MPVTTKEIMIDAKEATKGEALRGNEKDGSGQFKASVAMPEITPAPTMIVIQEIFGINEELRKKCETLAEQGYIAIAPDLFWRIEPGIELVDSVPEQLERAFELFGLFDADKGMEDLSATLKTARTLGRETTRGEEGGTPDRENKNKVGCVGYCLGGMLAYRMAAETDIDASVGYYGVGLADMLDKKESIHNPLLLHIAGEDEFTPPDQQAQIIEAFKDVPHVQTYLYEGQDHAFARGNGMHYDEKAATLANARTAEFLEKTLK